MVDSHSPELPYSIGTVNPGANKTLKTTCLLVYFNNIFVYNEGYEYDFVSRKWSVKEKFQLTGPAFNPGRYLVECHSVPTESGETVPLTVIVAKKNRKVRNKMILHSYGYYGLAYDIAYNNTYLAALEEGWSLAYAHIRGGNEKGRSWHQAAVKSNRRHSWMDLENCVAFLLKEGYTHPNILVLHSHSAGAITVWNAINRKPHLYKAAILSYPFLDVLTTLLDDQHSLAQSDFAEFGNPSQNLQVYNEIESYSPYETIRETAYPFLYIVGGLNDYRCPVYQIAKFVTKFRSTAEASGRFRLGEKGCVVKINEGSHEGVANLHEELMEGCEMLGALDHLIEQRSSDSYLK